MNRMCVFLRVKYTIKYKYALINSNICYLWLIFVAEQLGVDNSNYGNWRHSLLFWVFKIFEKRKVDEWLSKMFNTCILNSINALPCFEIVVNRVVALSSYITVLLKITKKAITQHNLTIHSTNLTTFFMIMVRIFWHFQSHQIFYFIIDNLIIKL